MSLTRLLLALMRLFFGLIAFYWFVGTGLEGLDAVVRGQWARAFASLSVSAFSVAAVAAILVGIRPLEGTRHRPPAT